MRSKKEFILSNTINKQIPNANRVEEKSNSNSISNNMKEKNFRN